MYCWTWPLTTYRSKQVDAKCCLLVLLDFGPERFHNLFVRGLGGHEGGRLIVELADGLGEVNIVVEYFEAINQLFEHLRAFQSIGDVHKGGRLAVVQVRMDRSLEGLVAIRGRHIFLAFRGRGPPLLPGGLRGLLTLDRGGGGLGAGSGGTCGLGEEVQTIWLRISITAGALLLVVGAVVGLSDVGDAALAL
jgi:hypothetical protein